MTTPTTLPALPAIPALPVRTDSDERFALLEFDGPTAPRTPDPGQQCTPESLVAMINGTQFFSDLKRIAGEFNDGPQVYSLYFRASSKEIQDAIRLAWRARRDEMLRDCAAWARTALRCFVPAYRQEHEGTIEASLSRVASEIPVTTRPTRAARGTARQVARTEASRVENARRTGDLIATAVKAGLGATLTRGRSRGKGLIKRGDIVTALTAIGAVEMAPPSPSAVKQLGEAIKTLNSQGLVARAALKHERGNGVKARWVIGTVNLEIENPSLGEKDLLIDLLADDTLKLTGGSGLADRVRGEYERRLAGETYSASAAWDWLVGRLVREYHVVDLDGEHYVAGGMVSTVRALVEALAPVIGRRISMRGVATSADIASDLAAGLATEATELRERYLRAVEASPLGIGARAATTILRDVATVRERVTGYTAILGDETTASVRGTLDALDTELRKAIDDTAQRGAMLEMD